MESLIPSSLTRANQLLKMSSPSSARNLLLVRSHFFWRVLESCSLSFFFHLCAPQRYLPQLAAHHIKGVRHRTPMVRPPRQTAISPTLQFPPQRRPCRAHSFLWAAQHLRPLEDPASAGSTEDRLLSSPRRNPCVPHCQAAPQNRLQRCGTHGIPSSPSPPQNEGSGVPNGR